MEGALATRLRRSPVSPPPSAAGPPPGSEEPPVPPELPAKPPSWPALDRLGLTQAIGGLALGLIALFSSYDHLTIAGRTIPIPQQWGIPLIAASVAIIFVDAQLASGSRLRTANETTRERNLASEERQRADRERYLTSVERWRAEQRENEADRERNRADQERNRAAEARERQRESLERLHQAAVLSARIQLDPSDINRARLQTFLALLNQPPGPAPLDEFQYFSRKALYPFTSELQSEVDRLAATPGVQGGLIVLGSLHTEMQALLEDRSAPVRSGCCFSGTCSRGCRSFTATASSRG